MSEHASQETETDTTRLMMLASYVERHQNPPNKGVTQGQLIHAGYQKQEISAAVSQGYIVRMPGAGLEYVVPSTTAGYA